MVRNLLGAILTLLILGGLFYIATAMPKEAIFPHPVNNTHVNVVYLFELNGHRVYRFYDAGEYRYITLPE